MRYKSVSLPEDLLYEIDRAIATGSFRQFAVRTKPRAIELAVRNFIASLTGAPRSVV
ncbi:MAG TPA: hypothetical protein VNZ52_17040 [Candidatus Thermoplasmatota archaeon]|nr:hypothetical protein [Candidatus Thermoplasmatota archaeon]